MSTELTTKPSALAIMASRFSVEPQKLLSTLKSTVFKGASDDELLALVVVANEYGLNPLTKEIYAFPAKGGGIVPVVSIDGWINRMNSNAQFDGIEFTDVFDDSGKPVSVTASIWRKDRTRPVKVTEYYAECYRNTDPWNKCPARMLRHKALSQCVRIAFGFGGVYDEDEGSDIAIKEATGRVVPPSTNGPAMPSLPAPAPKQKAPEPEKTAVPDPAPAASKMDPITTLDAEVEAMESEKDKLVKELRESMLGYDISAKAVVAWLFKNKACDSDRLTINNLPENAVRVALAEWA